MYILASVDITRKRLHFKVLFYPNSLIVPDVHTQTINHGYDQPWTNLSLLSIKNKFTNSHGLNGFCGTFRRLNSFAGFYIEDNSLNTDLTSTLLMQWVGTDSTPLTSALNQVTPFRNVGKYGIMGYDLPQKDTTFGYGIIYAPN